MRAWDTQEDGNGSGMVYGVCALPMDLRAEGPRHLKSQGSDLEAGLADVYALDHDLRPAHILVLPHLCTCVCGCVRACRRGCVRPWMRGCVGAWVRATSNGQGVGPTRDRESCSVMIEKPAFIMIAATMNRVNNSLSTMSSSCSRNARSLSSRDFGTHRFESIASS